jgi:hypothetical protein
MNRWLERSAIAGATIVEAMRHEALATGFCIAIGVAVGMWPLTSVLTLSVALLYLAARFSSP